MEEMVKGKRRQEGAKAAEWKPKVGGGGGRGGERREIRITTRAISIVRMRLNGELRTKLYYLR